MQKTYANALLKYLSKDYKCKTADYKLKKRLLTSLLDAVMTVKAVIKNAINDLSMSLLNAVIIIKLTIETRLTIRAKYNDKNVIVTKTLIRISIFLTKTDATFATSVDF